MLDTVNEQHNYLKNILENSPDGVFTISPELAIRYVNPAFCRILGFDADELINTQITEYLGDLNVLETCMVEVSDQGFCNDQETIFNRKDGSVVHISKNVQAICNDDGSLNEILISIRDLTEVHKLNKNLSESKQQLEKYTKNLETTIYDLTNTQKQLVESEKLASLGGLVAGIAHEINTPLGISVTSATSMHEELNILNSKFNDNTLKRTELEAFLQQANQACEILNTNLHRASGLVRSFKQVAVDQSVDDIRNINLSEYIDEILVSIGPSFKHSLIKVTTDCDNDIELITHPGAIYQIISNLVINSMTHAYNKEDEGKINIKVNRVKSDVVIEYSDDGKGIKQKNLDNIFDPFFTTRRGSGGSGLGLSIVYNLVTGSLKGKISVNSTESKGTSFKIVFSART